MTNAVTNAATSQPVTMSFFGMYEVVAQGDALPFATVATRALMAYIAVESDRAHSRETLAGLLWPDQSQASASTNLRQTLVRLRRTLGAWADPLLSITPRTIQFNEASLGQVEIDVTRFTTLLAECAAHKHAGSGRLSDPGAALLHCPECIARLQQAAVLYRGEFLQGLFLKQSEPFEEWILLRREQFHRQALTLLDTLTQHAESTGDFEHMRQYAQRQLALEPWSEGAHMQLMRAFSYMGQRTAAIAQFEICRRVLQTELGIEPGIEIVALYERIRTGKTDALSPTALAVPTPPNNLPIQLTAFIGRERELADLISLVRGSGSDIEGRLITLVGPGGMGKSRLALEAASHCLDAFTDGVFFVSLAPLTSPAGIALAISSILGLSVQGGDPTSTLLNAMRNRHMLLILDNFEHVIEGADIASQILQNSAATRIIATSRERLNVRGERVVGVEGMDYAVDAAAHPGQADETISPAVRLFVQSARRAQPDFRLTAVTRPAVQRICTLVQGMPLGLEMAAAWVETLTPDHIALEIERSADFLAFNWRDVPERRRSMRAVFEWSWQLLTDPERQLFSQLSVFRGGFTREAAQRVAGASLPALTRLVHKSLVRRNVAGRYEIHELLRQFAAEQLEAHAEEQDAVAQTHSTYYLDLLAQREQRLTRDDTRAAAAEIQVEIDNIRQAWSWAAEHGRNDALNRSVYAFWQFFAFSGGWSECERLFLHTYERGVAQQAQDAANSAPSQNAHPIFSMLLAIRASLLIALGKHEPALTLATQAIALAQTHADLEGEALGTLVRGQALRRLGQSAEARQTLLVAAQISSAGRTMGLSSEILPHVECRAWGWLCSIALTTDDVVEARRCVENAREISRALHKNREEMSSLTDLAEIAMLEGHFEAARRDSMAALELAGKLDYPWGIASCQRILGEIAHHLGELTLADTLTTQSIQISQDLGDTLSQASGLLQLGRLHTTLGNLPFAQDCFDENARLLEAIGMPARESFLRLLPLARLAIATDQGTQALGMAETAWRMAQALDGRFNQAQALVILGHARAHLRLGPAAATAYEQALRIFTDLGRLHQTLEPRAGLAQLALAQGQLATAMAHVEVILSTLQGHPRAGVDEPFWVYLTCCEVLLAAGDARAQAVIGLAQALLQTYASSIADGALRRSFLEQVPVNRQLAAL